MHERQWLQHDLLCYHTTRVGSNEEPWCFMVKDPELAENESIQPTPLADCTKICLARQLQLRDDLNDLRRAELLQLTREALLLLLGGDSDGSDIS